jgi:hypothetical protein
MAYCRTPTLSKMIEVAKGLEAPILLMWPRSLVPGADAGFSMLGLGDIVIPGQFTDLDAMTKSLISIFYYHMGFRNFHSDLPAF